MVEFAWDLMEPEEGVFDFTLFDNVIAHKDEYGLHQCRPKYLFAKRNPQKTGTGSHFAVMICR